MYEDAYELTDAEKQEAREILAEMSLRGGRLTNAGGRPIPYRVLRGRRYLVCEKGLLWRFAPEGTPQVPGRPTGVVRRNSAVEMWTGRWRRATTPEGKQTYAKCLVWVPVDANINGHSGISTLGWYRSAKGFKHPFDAPHAPTAEEIANLEGRKEATADAVYARMQEEGLNVPPTPSDEDGTPAPPRRSRRRAS